MTVILSLLILWSLILIFMLLWGLLSSLKTYNDFRKNLFGLPQQWMFSNYATALSKLYVVVADPNGGNTRIYIEGLLFNSLFYTLLAAFGSVFVPMITAYVTAKWPRWWSSRLIFWIVIFCMTIPIIGNMSSELEMTMKIGLYDTLVVGPFLKSSFLGMYFLIFYENFKRLNAGVTEAALIDGANQFQIMFRICVPMVMNLVGVMYVLNVIGIWNDYQTPLLYFPSHPTLALGIYMFQVSTDTELATAPIQFASAYLMLLPVLLVFIVFRNKIIGKLAISDGIKG